MTFTKIHQNGIRPLPKAYGALPASIWYQRARYDIERILPAYLTYNRFAAVVAFISPGRQWSRNITDAVRIVTHWHNHEPFPRSLSTYSMSTIHRTRDLLESLDYESFLTGPKIRAFYHCLINPVLSPNAPIDRHMRHIWFRNTEDKPVSPREYRIIHRRLIRLANSRHIPPCSLQAAMWEYELSQQHNRK